MDINNTKAATEAAIAQEAAEISAKAAGAAAVDEGKDLKAKASEAIANAKEQLGAQAQNVTDKVKSFAADALEKGAGIMDTVAAKAHTAAAGMKS